MKLTWYGHSCFMLESADGSIVFDPYSPGSVPGLTLPPLTADEVICSHGHGDHNYTAGVKRSGRTTSFSVLRIDCFHDEVQGLKRGKNHITAVDAENMRVVHLGDLGHMLSPEQLERLGAVDVLLIPVGGYYTIDAAQAHALAGAIKPRITVPMHYRGAGFGYDVISTVDDFAALSENVKRLDGSVLEITGSEPAGTIILRCPAEL